MTVLDYSNWRPPSPKALVDHGVTGVVRYIAPAAWKWPKAITRAELDSLRAVGLEVAFNFEKNPGDHAGGAAGGAKAGVAIATAMSELGVPTEVPVFVSYDTEVPLAQYALVLDYHQAVIREVHGRPIDAYGQNDLLEFLASKGVLTRGWMSESTAFPGNDSPKAHTVLQQHYGQQIAGLPGAYDMNTIVCPDWGQHPRPHAPPVSQTHPKGDDMGMVVIQPGGTPAGRFKKYKLFADERAVLCSNGARLVGDSGPTPLGCWWHFKSNARPDSISLDPNGSGIVVTAEDDGTFETKFQ